MSTTLPHGIIQINEGNISWYGDITANWQLIDSKIGEYDAAVASIPAPANNGTLTINYAGTIIAMFGADDAGNVTADIPAPGDGTLTVTQGGSTLGSFNANQAAAETIDIPAPGDGTLTVIQGWSTLGAFTANQRTNSVIAIPEPGDGTLTIRLNGVDVQTFTANQANDVVADIIPPVPGDGTLTIKVNGSTAGTFTANASTNATANIVVPTAVSELTNDSGYLTSSSNLDASKLTSGTVDIARLPQGALERLVKVANEAARYALTTADVQLGDTVQQLDTGIMYVVTDTGHLDSAAGYTEYTAGTAASAPWSGVTGKPTFAAVATSGAYSDLTGTPTIPTVNNGTLTIQKNGTTVKTFTANASSNVTANITVPTKTSDLNNDSGFITGVTWNDVSNKPSFATVATSGSYNDLSNKPTIPTVNNATLTIQKNGTTVKTFTANASSNVTCNITVPTKTSDLTNDSGFLTSHQSLSNYSTLANTIKSLSISGRTITYTKGDNSTGTLTTQDTNTWTAMVGATSSSNGSVGYVNAVPPKDGYNTKYLRADGTWQVPPDHTYTVNNATLTIQKNGTTVKTFTANASSNVTANITVPTKTSELTNDSGFLTSADLLPTGSYIQFAGSQAPAGFLVCNGGAISRTTYSALFAVIGTTYGSGDGSATFNLPNLTDRFLQGSTTSGTVKNAGLPNIEAFADGTLGLKTVNGAFGAGNTSTDNLYDGSVSAYHTLNFNASWSDSIYGNSTTVQPPALTCLICIKY